MKLCLIFSRERKAAVIATLSSTSSTEKTQVATVNAVNALVFYLDEVRVPVSRTQFLHIALREAENARTEAATAPSAAVRDVRMSSRSRAGHVLPTAVRPCTLRVPFRVEPEPS